MAIALTRTQADVAGSADTSYSITTGVDDLASVILTDEGTEHQVVIALQDHATAPFLKVLLNNIERMRMLHTGKVGLGLAPTWADLEIRPSGANSGCRLYMQPLGTVASGLTAGIKLFGTDFSTDQTNYDDFGIYNHTDGLHFNSKHNGTGATKDFIFSYQDSIIVARLYVPSVAYPAGGLTVANLGTNKPVVTDENGVLCTGRIVTVTADYTVVPTDTTVIVNSASPVTITLLTAVGCGGRLHTIKNVNTGDVTVEPAGAETIDGAANATIADQWGVLRLQSNNANWIVV